MCLSVLESVLKDPLGLSASGYVSEVLLPRMGLGSVTTSVSIEHDHDDGESEDDEDEEDDDDGIGGRCLEQF